MVSFGMSKKGVTAVILVTTLLAVPKLSAAEKLPECRDLTKTTTLRNCSATVTYEVEVDVGLKRLSFHVRFRDDGPNAVFFLADWPPMVAQNPAAASISVALGEPALQSSELPRMIRVSPGATVERVVNVPISLKLTQVKSIYFTLFFATDDPGFFDHLTKDYGGDKQHWFTSNYFDQCRYTDLVLSDTIEFPLPGHLAEGIKTHRAEKGK